jgi:hypothetical protein
MKKIATVIVAISLCGVVSGQGQAFDVDIYRMRAALDAYKAEKEAKEYQEKLKSLREYYGLDPDTGQPPTNEQKYKYQGKRYRYEPK